MSEIFSVFMRHSDFLKETIIIQLKTLKEYKSNLYMVILSNIIFVLTAIIGFYVLKKNFENIFYWNLHEYIFFIIMWEITVFTFAPWFRKLSSILISGDFNLFLLRPINVRVMYMFKTTFPHMLTLSILYILSFLIYIIFFIPFIDIYRLFLTLILLFLGGVFFSSIVCFIDSLAFFMKKNEFLFELNRITDNMFGQFPASFFSGTNYEKIGYLIPITYSGVFTTEFYFGYFGMEKWKFLVLILICFIFFLLSLSSILWKKGIKKYEAFG